MRKGKMMKNKKYEINSNVLRKSKDMQETG